MLHPTLPTPTHTIRQSLTKSQNHDEVPGPKIGLHVTWRHPVLTDQLGSRNPPRFCYWENLVTNANSLLEPDRCCRWVHRLFDPDPAFTHTHSLPPHATSGGWTEWGHSMWQVTRGQEAKREYAPRRARRLYTGKTIPVLGAKPIQLWS